MALESFGTQTAVKIDHAAKLCHDLLRDSDGSEPIEFEAAENGIWKVEPGIFDGKPCVVIRLGVG